MTLLVAARQYEAVHSICIDAHSYCPFYHLCVSLVHSTATDCFAALFLAAPSFAFNIAACFLAAILIAFLSFFLAFLSSFVGITLVSLANLFAFFLRTSRIVSPFSVISCLLFPFLSGISRSASNSCLLFSLSAFALSFLSFFKAICKKYT